MAGINYNKLHYFYEISKIKNLSRASELLFVTQSSLSKTVKDLEFFFDTPLFVRTGRSLVLTPAGEALQKECARIFDDEEALILNVKTAAAMKRQQIRFGYMLFNSFYWLPQQIQSFETQHPLIKIQMQRYQERELLTQALLKQHIDAALKIFTMNDIIPELGFKVLSEQHLSIIAPKDHPIASLPEVHLSDLRHERFIMLGNDISSSEYHFATDWCHKCGFTPKITHTHENVETVLLMVQSHAGISLLSEFAPIEHMDGLVSIPLANSPTIYSGLFWNKYALTAQIQCFIESLSHLNSQERKDLSDT